MTGQQSPTPHPRWLVLVLVAVALLLGVLAVKRAVNLNADFNGNYNWWRINLQESTLPVRRGGPHPQDPDSYPPITYALFAPVAMLPLWAAATLWYAMNLACSIYLWMAARDWLQSKLGVRQLLFTPDLSRYWRLEPQLFLNLVVLAILPSWIGCLLLGQNTLPLMSLTWAGYQAVRQNRNWLAGGLLGLATTLKILPVVFVLPFVVRPKVRLLAAYNVTGLLLVFGLGSLYFGPRTNWEFHLKWLQFAANGSENGPADPRNPNTLRGSMRYHNQSFEPVLARLMMDVPIHNQENAPRVNLWQVSPETWRMTRTVVMGMCVLLGLVALACAASSLSREDETALPLASATSVETYSILCLLQLFISPLVWSHYYMWLFWPWLWVLVSAWRGRRSGYALFVLWLAALPLLSVPVARAVGTHLWLTVVLYLWICWPRFVALSPRKREKTSLVD